MNGEARDLHTPLIKIANIAIIGALLAYLQQITELMIVTSDGYNSATHNDSQLPKILLPLVSKSETIVKTLKDMVEVTLCACNS